MKVEPELGSHVAMPAVERTGEGDVTSELAFAQVRKNWKLAHASWDDGSPTNPQSGQCLGIFRQEPYDPHHRPKFKLDRDKPGFMIGSCFAREIELALSSTDIRIPVFMRDPKLEDVVIGAGKGRTNAGYLNRFNPASMQLEIENLTGARTLPDDRLIYQATKNHFVDAHYAASQKPAHLDKLLGLRSFIRDRSQEFLVEGDFLVLTLGLTQALYDRETGEYLNSRPSAHVASKAPDRFVGVILGFEESLEALERIRNLYREANANAAPKMIVTVSPVAMHRTFDGRDVVVANTGSKSTLRAVAEVFCNRHDDVDYFPSYEIVTHTQPRVAYHSDLRHVHREVVNGITDKFIASYFD